MNRGIRLARIQGIEIAADWSLLIIFFLITFSLAIGVFPAWHPDWSVTLSWVTALAASVLFFLSITAHELSHAIVGSRGGVKIRRITLFIFGGMAHMENEPPTWKVEFRMAIVGPLTSLVLGALFLFGASAMIGRVDADEAQIAELFAQLSPVESAFLWLGWVNVVLAIFNMVPGFPLDGGRVLRAIAWGVTGSYERATRLASSMGQAFAWILMGFGIAMILGVEVPIFGSGLVNGLWLALIGWFLNNAALASQQQLRLREALYDVPIARLMQTQMRRVPPDLSVQELADRFVISTGQRTFPVEASNGQFLGLVCLSDLKKAAQQDLQSTRIDSIMTPAAALASVSADDPANAVLELLARREVNQIPVVEGDRLIGLVSREELVKWLALRIERDKIGDEAVGGRL